jgi:hypothetical protein
MKAREGLFTDLAVEAAQGCRRGFRVAEQRACRMQLAIITAQARQCFNAGNASGSGIDERLENSKRLAIEHCAVP